MIDNINGLLLGRREFIFMKVNELVKCVFNIVLCWRFWMLFDCDHLIKKYTALSEKCGLKRMFIWENNNKTPHYTPSEKASVQKLAVEATYCKI